MLGVSFSQLKIRQAECGWEFMETRERERHYITSTIENTLLVFYGPRLHALISLRQCSQQHNKRLKATWMEDSFHLFSMYGLEFLLLDIFENVIITLLENYLTLNWQFEPMVGGDFILYMAGLLPNQLLKVVKFYFYFWFQRVTRMRI